MTTKQENLVVLGLLSHLTEGQLYLEDVTGSIPISLKETVCTQLHVQYLFFISFFFYFDLFSLLDYSKSYFE